MKQSQEHLDAAQATTLDETAAGSWIDNEVVGCQFQDVRHGKRLRQLTDIELGIMIGVQLAGN